jgi:hypothetical protein
MPRRSSLSTSSPATTRCGLMPDPATTENRVQAAYWLAFSESVGAADTVLLAAENRAHEAAMDAGLPDDFDAARAVALAVLAVVRLAAPENTDTAERLDREDICIVIEAASEAYEALLIGWGEKDRQALLTALGKLQDWHQALAVAAPNKEERR